MTPKRQLEHPVDAARKSGWVVEAITEFLGNFAAVATKQLPTGRSELGFTVFPDGSAGRKSLGPDLIIRLTHG